MFSDVVVEQATAPTAWVSCPGCEIPGRPGFAFYSSYNSNALMGYSQSGRVWIAGMQGG